MDYERILAELEQTGVHDIARYRERLESNAGRPDKIEDCAFEGIAAIAFQASGFQVTMRESPDLHLEFNGRTLYAEVKHFRSKRQDESDGTAMMAAGEKGCLVEYGDTTEREDRAAWNQVADVEIKKVSQYLAGAPNILVLASSSAHAIDDAIMPTVVGIIDETAATGKKDGLRKLNGILLLSSCFTIAEHRSVWFYPTRHQEVPLEGEMLARLQGITEWRGLA